MPTYTTDLHRVGWTDTYSFGRTYLRQKICPVTGKACLIWQTLDANLKFKVFLNPSWDMHNVQTETDVHNYAEWNEKSRRKL